MASTNTVNFIGIVTSVESLQFSNGPIIEIKVKDIGFQKANAIPFRVSEKCKNQDRITAGDVVAITGFLSAFNSKSGFLNTVVYASSVTKITNASKLESIEQVDDAPKKQEEAKQEDVNVTEDDLPF